MGPRVSGIALVAAVTALLTGCDVEPSREVRSTDTAEVSAVAEHGRVQRLVDGETGLLGEVSALTLGPGGALFVTDRMRGVVHQFDTAGALVRTIGRQGQGPGEFRGPRVATVTDSTIIVLDEGNARIQVLTLDGEALTSEPLPAAPAGGHWALGSHGIIVRPTLGLDSVLFKVSGANGRELGRVGVPIGTPSTLIQPRAVKQDLIEGRVPDIFKNTAKPVLNHDSTIWVISPARATVERFSMDGVRLDSILIDFPEFAGVTDENMQANAALPGFRMRPPEFLLDGQVLGQSLWVLAATGEQGAARLLEVLPGVGAAGAMDLPGVSGAHRFVIDVDRGWAYFGTEDLTALVRVALPRSGPIGTAH